ncbi:MAG: hypothetical protein ACM3PV_08345 [Betaproteobacteria bacterium]
MSTSQTRTPRPPAEEAEGDARVPLFGTWTAIHLAVIACALGVMALLAAFSRWPF